MLLGRNAACLCALALIAAFSAAGAAKPAARAHLELKELTVRFDGAPIARLHADGRTESVGASKPGKDATFSAGPTLHADGTIELTKAGFTARLDPDGDIYVVSPPDAHQPDVRYGHLAGDRIALAGDGDRSIRLEGAELVTYADTRRTNVLGVIDPPSMGRTALIMTAAFFIDLAITTR